MYLSSFKNSSSGFAFIWIALAFAQDGVAMVLERTVGKTSKYVALPVDEKTPNDRLRVSIAARPGRQYDWPAPDSLKTGAYISRVLTRMASAVVDSKEQSHPRPHPHPHPHPHPQLSLTIDAPPSAPGFPSPSSSFVPPPIPGAHEFAMMPVPPGKRLSQRTRTSSEEGGKQPNGAINGGLASPATPRGPSPLSPASAVTPTATSVLAGIASKPASLAPVSTASTSASASTSTLASSAPSTPSAKRVSFPAPPPRTPTTPTATSSGSGDMLTSWRPAPQSPALSRRTSLARSTSSASSRGTQSRRTSRILMGVRHRLSQSVSAADVEGTPGPAPGTSDRTADEALVQSPAPIDSASTSAASASAASSTAAAWPRPPVVVRDFAFAAEDERRAGLGPDVPRPCDPFRLARRLRGEACASDYGDALHPDGDGEADDDDDDAQWPFLRFRAALGEPARAGGGSGVDAADFARNFTDDDDDDDDGARGEEALDYEEQCAETAPGLYRAHFAFEAEGPAEMSLAEGQLLRVFGSGATILPAGAPEEDSDNGGAGWAVAADRAPPLVRADLDVLAVNALVGARTDAGRVWDELWAAAAAAAEERPPPRDAPPPPERRALVPDSFIVLIRGEGEREADAHVRLVQYLEWLEEERKRQEQEYAELLAAGEIEEELDGDDREQA
ncbi:hypothetical protein GGX14DRAFT_564944 [Mycena pura]|uniref:SH3 domain-containing protein n=1 Tax=Mycena pura TaxID=153505 RepID=A0AAD6VJT0_9AGAR|nr:hypothetical protein GGX14DRAFT_564944 [Mycena pura]